MPYRILPDGTVEGDSIEETIALHRALSATKTIITHDPPPQPAKRPVSGRPKPIIKSDDASWPVFTKALAPHHRDILKAIKAGTPRTLRSDLIAVCVAHKKGFPRTMEAIKAAIETAGLKKADVFTREAEGFGEKKTTFFLAGRLLRTNEV